MATSTGTAGGLATSTPASTSSLTTASPYTTTGAPAVDIASSTLSLIYIYSISTTAEPTTSASPSSSQSIGGGAIAGIVVGSVAALIILALALFCYSRAIARKRRAEAASLHPSRHTAPSRAYSHATTAQGTFVNNGNTAAHRYSQYATSVGAHSAGAATANRSFRSHDILPDALPQELPTPHNRSELEGSRGTRKTQVQVLEHPRQQPVRSPQRPVRNEPPLEPARIQQRSTKNPKKPVVGHQWPEVSEVYGSHAYPVELQAGSMPDLRAVIQEMKETKAPASKWEGPGTEGDSGSEGYLSPRWPPPGSGMGSETGLVSDLDGATDAGDCAFEAGTEDGTTTAADERSIYIYYRPGSGWDTEASPVSTQQSKIAQAISQASRSTLSMSATPR